MTVDIKPIDPVNRPAFAGVVSGLDLTRPLSKEEIAAVHAGMDEFGVLVFHDQKIDDEQQLAFSRSLGPLEQATGDIAAPHERRMSMDLNDISNLDRNNRILARDDRRRLFGLGNQLWHSDSSFKAVPAKYSLLSARTIPSAGGNTEFADMRAAYDALDEQTKREVHDLICLHSQIFSRGILGFTDFTEEERTKWAPVRQRLVRRHPATGRLSLYLASHAGAIEGWPVPEARAFLRDLTEHATQRQFVYAHVWRPHDLVMWDNRVTMHRARRYDHTEVRDMRRTTLTNEVSSLEQAPPPLAHWMRLQFLGSGDAFGSGGRFNTCFHLERAAHGNVLVDCGASSMVAIRKWQVDPNAVSTVLVSHLHGDHFAGLPFLLLDAQLVSRRSTPLTLAGPPGLRERLEIVMEAMFAGSTGVERRFALEVRELVLHERTELNGLAVTPYLMKHYSGAPSYALRIETEGKVLTYSGDTEWVEELIPAGRDADLFICEAYFFDKAMKYHIDYTTLAKHLLEIGARRTIVTHMSAELLGRQGEIALEAAHDGLVVEF